MRGGGPSEGGAAAGTRVAGHAPHRCSQRRSSTALSQAEAPAEVGSAEFLPRSSLFSFTFVRRENHERKYRLCSVPTGFVSERRANLRHLFQEVQKRFPDGVPLLDPVDDMGIQDQGLKKIIQKVEAFEHRMYSHPLHNDPGLETVYTLCERKAQVRAATGVVSVTASSGSRQLCVQEAVLSVSCRLQAGQGEDRFTLVWQWMAISSRVFCELCST